MKEKLKEIIQIIFVIICLIVNLIVLFCNIKLNTSINFLFKNYILFFTGGVVVFGGYYCFRKYRMKISENLIIGILSVLLLCFEIFVSLNALFRSGWDVGMLYDTAYYNVFDKFPIIKFDCSKSYFETYPNNVFFLLYEMFFAVVVKLIGKGPKTLSFLLVMNNCFIFVLAGFMLYFCVRKVTQNRKISLSAWIMYAILVGTSSWFLVPYSDSLGLLFPIFILFVYMFYNKNIYLKTFLISFLAFLGYQIKPQILIVFIAIIIIKLLDIYKFDKKNVLKIFKQVFVVFLTYLLISLPIGYVKSNIMKLDENKKIGLTHFLMMGMNTETNGVWSGEDVSFSSSFPTTSIRTQKNLEEFTKRVKKIGISGLALHLRNKILVNFNDGTFFFGEEGSFYVWSYPTNLKTSEFVKTFVYSNGKYYIYLATIRQSLWLIILFLMLFSCLKSKDKDVLVVQLSLIGLFLFEMLFEARSRYLFIYVPYFIILSNLGLNLLGNRLMKKYKK